VAKKLNRLDQLISEARKCSADLGGILIAVGPPMPRNERLRRARELIAEGGELCHRLDACDPEEEVISVLETLSDLVGSIRKRVDRLANTQLS